MLEGALDRVGGNSIAGGQSQPADAQTVRPRTALS